MKNDPSRDELAEKILAQLQGAPADTDSDTDSDSDDDDDATPPAPQPEQEGSDDAASDAGGAPSDAERQAYAHGLGAAVTFAQSADPTLSAGAKTNWAALARANPQLAQAKWRQYQGRLAALRNAIGNHVQVQAGNQNNALRYSNAVLGQSLDFWNDPAKREAFRADLRRFLGSSGFHDHEARNLNDPRAIMVARKAMLYDQLMAQQAKIGASRKAWPASRVLTPNASADDGGNEKAAALRKRAARSGRMDDRAAAILASLD